MAILLPLPHRSMIGEPFCDYLNVTVPLEQGADLFRQLRPMLDVMGLTEVVEGVYSLPDKGGSFKFSARGKVSIFSASGGFLDALRKHDLFAQYLFEIAAFPHRVSMLHATADYSVPSAPEVLQKLKSIAYKGDISLTRKAVQPKDVFCVFSPTESGEESGTVYLGNRKNADVWAKVYDKGHERASKGLSYQGSIVRVEVAIQSGIGATLRDAYTPASIFYNFASKSLVTPPKGYSEWRPEGEGFVLPEPKQDFTGVQRIKSILEFSPDLVRVFEVAQGEFGSDALQVILAQVKKRFDLYEATQQAMRAFNGQGGVLTQE